MAIPVKLTEKQFQMEAGFDPQAARQACFKRHWKQNIPENRRKRVKGQPGPQRFFDQVR